MLPSISRSFVVVALLALVTVGVPLVAATPAPASAETPTEIVEALADGVYIHSTRTGDASPEMFASVIDEATKDGISLIVIVPDESIPSASAFALRVRQAADADIAIVFDREEGVEASVVEDLDDRRIQALEAAREAATPTEAVSAYFTNITEEPEREVPDVVRTITNGVFYLLLILGAVVFIELGLRRFKNRSIRI